MPHRHVVTRFAPSPTGYLHIGGARTALFNWAFARKHGGTFILRLEDTDAARSSAASAKSILEDMQWLGIDWDEGPDPEAENPIKSDIGSHGPYSQSQRLPIYNEHIARLVAEGKAYEKDGAIVFRMPKRDITVDDLILGPVTTPADKIIDLVIKKSDGFPTFHFANVIDDATMGVTHVIRAQEHLNNTHKHLALFEALGLAPPKYAHIPLIFNADATKMSKRDKAKAARNAALVRAKQVGMDCVVEEIASVDFFDLDALQHDVDQYQGITGTEAVIKFLDKTNDNPIVIEAIRLGYGIALPEIDVHDFRRSGYRAETLCNYIALLGWSPKAESEKFDNAWLAENFSLDGVGKSNAKFDRDKLLNFNGAALQAMAPAQFAEKLGEYVEKHSPEYDAIRNDAAKWALFAEGYRQRAKTLAEPAVSGKFFITPADHIQLDPKAREKVLVKDAGFDSLEKLLPVIEAIADWSPEAIEAAVKGFAESSELGLGKVAQPIRVAVTGTSISPPIGATLAILGKDETLARIRRCLAARSA
jgi:glutamyl/glutaminyl-tRNA synthetase